MVSEILPSPSGQALAPLPQTRSGRIFRQKTRRLESGRMFAKPAAQIPCRSCEVSMFRWFQALMPREDRFFALYNRHAQTLVQGAEALRELLDGGPGVAAAAQKVFAFETEADAIAREV